MEKKDKDRVKFSISSDGTSEGTKIVLKGDNLVESKNLVSCSFYARAAAAFPNFDGQMEQNAESISFNYTSLEKNDKGEKTYTKYEFNLAEDKYEPKITPLGQPVPMGEGEDIDTHDNLIGRDSKLVAEVLSFVGKTKRFIPSRDILVTRSATSLQDMLDDIKKEL